MTPSEYTQQVLKTEARDLTPVMERFKDPSRAALVFQLFANITELSNMLDLSKKDIFYGKELEGVADAKANALVEAGKAEILDILQVAQNTILSSDKNVRILHSVLGMASEVGEIITCFMEAMSEGNELDVVNFKEELSDIQWYTSVGLDALDSSLEEVWHLNIEKLKKRYPGQKFTEEAAINRDTNSERKVMDEINI